MRRLVLVFAGLLIVVAGSWTVVATAAPPSGAAPVAAPAHAHGAAAAASASPIHHASPAERDEPAGGSGAPSTQEVMFVTMMLDHHQQALDMGQILAGRPGVPARVANLAASIQVAQTSEIGDSRSWLAAWAATGATGAPHAGHAPTGGGTARDDDSAPMTMRGMIGPEGFARLASAESTEAARVYLELMIEHHEGAIESASAVFSALSNPWVISFARHIVNEQTVEVDGMRRILASLS